MGEEALSSCRGTAGRVSARRPATDIETAPSFRPPRRIGIFLLLLILPALRAGASPPLRIGLFQRERFVRIAFTATGPARIAAPSREAFLEPGESVEIGLEGGSLRWRVNRRREAFRSRWLHLLPGAPQGGLSLRPSSSRQRVFKGRLLVSARQGRLSVIEELPLEEYVPAVTALEMPSGWPIEARTAQEVVARSFAAANRGRHRAEGFDLCATTHCQLYGGSLRGQPAAPRAAGWILTRHGRPLEALYASTCGGATASSFDVWPGRKNRPEIRPVRDGPPSAPFCRFSPHYRWTCRFTAGELSEALRASPEAGFRGDLEAIRIARTDPRGRVLQVALGGGGLRPVPAVDFWKAVAERWGWGRVKSTRFELWQQGSVYIFRGYGLGHGVGLCQWGARQLARQGRSFRQILAHYFPQSRLIRAE
ncbi:MAG: SpoIID/LytB domain-containing protein [Armatimonadetes bacterium]|nr:SpoIID/LytB domain-containing protein [Armatimonadota bacterium]